MRRLRRTSLFHPSRSICAADILRCKSKKRCIQSQAPSFINKELTDIRLFRGMKRVAPHYPITHQMAAIRWAER